MDILSYLSELIQTRKAVGIAGLGTVYKKKLPGRYDAETHSFIPPSYTLHFTPELKEETLLADYISKERNVSNDTANYFINEFSEGLLRELNDHQEVSLGDLGKLVNIDDQLSLEPAGLVNYGFDFCGLPAVKAGDEVIEPAVIPETAEPEILAEELIPETPFVEETNDETLPAETQVQAPAVEEYVAEESVTGQDETETPAEEPAIENADDETLPVEAELQAPAIEEYVAEESATGQDETETTVADEPAAEAEEPETKEPAIEATEEPEEVSALESVIADNESLEENPGDQEELNKHDEQKLREEIEALNFYRSQVPAENVSAPEQEEVIWEINQSGIKAAPAEETKEEETIPVAPPVDVYPPEPETRTTPLYLKLIMGFLILLIVMAAAYFVKPGWFSGLTGEKPSAPALQKAQPAVTTPPVNTAIDSPIVKDSAKKDTVKNTSVPAPAKSIPVTATPAKTADTAVVVYEIIGASMHDQKEADGFIAQMKKSGITAKVVTGMSGRRLKMSIATLKDEGSAKIEMERLSKKLKIPGIYIYRNKQ